MNEWVYMPKDSTGIALQSGTEDRRQHASKKHRRSIIKAMVTTSFLLRLDAIRLSFDWTTTIRRPTAKKYMLIFFQC